MDESDFDGTLVLEKMAELGKLDDFWAAVDADHLTKARTLMRRAGVDSKTIAIVLQKMEAADGNH